MAISSWVDTQSKKLTKHVKGLENWIGGYGTSVERAKTRIERNLKSQAERYDPFKLKEKHIRAGRKGILGNAASRKHYAKVGGSEFNIIENLPLGISKFGVPWWQRGAVKLDKLSKRKINIRKPTIPKQWKVKVPTVKKPLVGKNIKNLKIGKPIRRISPKIRKLPSTVKKNKGKIGTGLAASGILSSTTGQKAWIPREKEEWSNWI